MYKLFLDDQLDDPNTPKRHTPNGYIGAKSSADAIELVKNQGAPIFLDLDHDLGDNDTALIFLKWLVENVDSPPEYTIHSENPVGKENIISFMESWKKSFTL